MNYPNNILYYIGQVENASEERKINYLELSNRLNKTFQRLDTSSILLKEINELEEHEAEFPFFKLNHHSYDGLQTVFGAVLNDGYSTPFSNVKFPRWMGEIGLLLSVYRGLKKFLETDKEYLLWLEDDTKCYDHFENNFLIYLNNINFSFDFITLGVREDQKLFYESYKNYYEFNNPVFCKVFPLYWAGSILISRSGAEKFIKEFEEKSNTYPWDWLIFNVRSNNVEAQIYDTYAIRLDVPQLFYLDLDISPNSTIIDVTHTF